jgi:hypothetical protein
LSTVQAFTPDERAVIDLAVPPAGVSTQTVTGRFRGRFGHLTYQERLFTFSSS